MARAQLRLVSRSRDDAPPSAPPLDDARLLAAIRSGDEAAAAELHERLRPRVERTIAALVGSADPDRDDLTQESFVQIVLSLDRWRGECSLETWAATIAARTAFKFLRHRTVVRRAFRDNGGRELERSGPSSSRQLVARDLAHRIREHLDAIDEEKAEAFVLHDVCGFDAREVAQIAGIGEAGAHARIARGRRELHARLAEDPELRDALEGWESDG